jgi:hypothetical protein
MVEMPDRIAAGLAEELDALSPLRPLAAQARYHGPARALRVGGLALAGAAAALLLTAIGGFATFATGSPNPEVWTVQFAAGLHQLQDPDAGPARPSSVQPSQPAPEPRGVPAPAATAAAGGGAPEGQESPRSEEKRSPDPRGVRPSAEPTESPRPGPEPSGSGDDHRSSPSPSPRPTGQSALPTPSRLGVVDAMARPSSAAHQLETEVSP